MKKILTLALAIGCGAAMAQKSDNVGIGTTKPDPSALLDLNSNSKGFLLPRMSEAQRNAIKSPAIGLMIFQTDQTIGTYTYDGTTWQPSNARTAATQVAGAWDKQGNAIDATDFLGSTNNFPLVFRVNNVRAGFIDNTGAARTFVGYQAGNSVTSGQYNTAFGYQAMLNNSAGQNNVAVGNGAMLGATGSNNIGVGANVLHGNGLATGGNDNVAVGHFSAFKNTSGFNNVGLGTFTLYNNTAGNNNLAVGTFAMENSGTGSFNVGIGSSALRANTSGSFNMAIGANALAVNTGSQNVAIGAQALSANMAGTGNVAIGNQAGQNESGSEKLYIANSNTATPLIYGDFAAKYVTIGDITPAQRTQGIAAGGYNLLVKGGILTEKVKVALATTGDWADYVFEPSYKAKMMKLEDVEKFTIANKHLPNVPSAQEMVDKGMEIGHTSKIFMEKIEELTLYIIELNKEIQALKKQNSQK